MTWFLLTPSSNDSNCRQFFFSFSYALILHFNHTHTHGYCHESAQYGDQHKHIRYKLLFFYSPPLNHFLRCHVHVISLEVEDKQLTKTRHNSNNKGRKRKINEIRHIQHLRINVSVLVLFISIVSTLCTYVHTCLQIFTQKRCVFTSILLPRCFLHCISLPEKCKKCLHRLNIVVPNMT